MAAEPDAEVVEQLARALARRAEGTAPGLVEEALAAAREDVAAALRAAGRRALVAGALARLADEAEPAGGAGPAQAGRRGWYLYGITTTRVAPPRGAAGIDGASLRTVDAAGLRGVTSEIDAATLADEAVTADQTDPDALARRVRDHDEVVRALAASGPSVPLRFGTVVADEADVRALLERCHDGLERTLARLGRAAEWGVKGSWDHAALRAHVRGGDPAGGSRPDGPVAGADYLRAKQRDREAERSAQAVRDEVLAACHARLTARAREAALLPLRAAAPDDVEPALVLNASYLVGGDGVERFQAEVAALSAEHAVAGLRLELTGPWPPYSFVGPDALGGRQR